MNNFHEFMSKYGCTFNSCLNDISYKLELVTKNPLKAQKGHKNTNYLFNFH